MIRSVFFVTEEESRTLGVGYQIDSENSACHQLYEIDSNHQIVSERHAAGREMCLWGFIGSHQHFIFTGLIV